MHPALHRLQAANRQQHESDAEHAEFERRTCTCTVPSTNCTLPACLASVACGVENTNER